MTASIVTLREAPPAGERLWLLVVGDGVLASEPLPAHGELVIGRAPECDVRIEHGSISRTHARLLLDELHVVDAGSANGTWVGDRRIAPDLPTLLRVNEAFRLGSITLIVQRRSEPLRTYRVRSHEYFEDRLEDECGRAGRHDATFAIAHVVLDDPSIEIHGALVGLLRDGDLVARYAPGELELLLPDTAPDAARALTGRLEAVLAAHRVDARVGLAAYPGDGRDPSALAARARSRARGSVADEDDAGPVVVVADERMQALHQLVERIAAVDINVLLEGETGVGKEVFAELIHRRSRRAKAPFLKVNCAALSEPLLELELFGNEKGAFAGAEDARPGLLEIAEGGCVFLDEVGELASGLQAKLLRVLDERTVLRAGGVTPRPIDVRIISATHRDLDAEVERGAFRTDLLFRLDAMSLLIPPLRERTPEIAPLARQFLAAAAARLGRPAPRLTDAALAVLRGHSWPGNVRELKNVIERAVILASDDVIDADAFPRDKMRATVVAAHVRGVHADAPPDPAAEERRRLLDALETCAGNQTHAAKLLGISRRTLINKLEKYALPRPRKR